MYLLSLAETVNADYIITGDKDLLTLETHKEIKILNFTDFIKLIELGTLQIQLKCLSLGY